MVLSVTSILAIGYVSVADKAEEGFSHVVQEDRDNVFYGPFTYCPQ